MTRPTQYHHVAVSVGPHAAVLYRVGFAADGWAVEVHRCVSKTRAGVRHVKVEVLSEEGRAAVKEKTGGTMRLYPPPSRRRSTYVPD